MLNKQGPYVNPSNNSPPIIYKTIIVLFIFFFVALPFTLTTVHAETYTDGQVVTLGDWELSYNRKWNGSSWTTNSTTGFGARYIGTSGDVVLPTTDLIITNMDYALQGKTLTSVSGVIQDTVKSMVCFLYGSTVGDLYILMPNNTSCEYDYAFYQCKTTTGSVFFQQTSVPYTSYSNTVTCSECYGAGYYSGGNGIGAGGSYTCRGCGGSSTQSYTYSTYYTVPGMYLSSTNITLYAITESQASAAQTTRTRGGTEATYGGVKSFDNISPVINDINPLVGKASVFRVGISATDNMGIADYGFNTSSTPPTEGWTTDNPISITANGNYYLFARDTAGNISEGYPVIVSEVDHLAPIVSGVNVPSGWAQSKTVTVSAADAEATSTSISVGFLSYAFSDTTTPPGTFERVASKTYTVNGTYYVFVKDSVGNMSEPFSFVVNQIDTSKPTASGSASSTWAKTNTVTVTAADTGGSGIKDYAISLNSGTPTTGWQVSNVFTVSENGAYQVYARDNAGNISLAGMAAVGMVDADAPIISSAVASTAWATSNTITITATDTGGSVIKDYAIRTADAAPSTGWQASNVFTVTSNGTYYTFVRDNAGNISASKAVVVNKVDTVAPTTSPTSATNWGKTNIISANATDTGGSQVKEVAISTSPAVPSTGWQDLNDFFVVGNATYYVFARDNAGNVSAPKPVVVSKVDITPPTPNAATVPTSPMKSTTVTASASDSQSGGITFSFTTAATPVPASSTFTTTATKTYTANGTYYFFAKDAVGNISAAKQFVVSNVDTQPPTFTVAGGQATPPTTRKGTTIALTVTAQDTQNTGYSSTVSLTYSINDSAFSAANTLTVTENGTYTIKVKDAAGNITTKTHVVNIFDQDPPNIESVNYPETWGQSSVITITASDVTEPITYRLNRTGAWQSSNQFTVNSNGEHTVEAKDNFGNIASETFNMTKVDLVEPYITNLSSVLSDVVSNEAITWEPVAGDDASGVKEVRAIFQARAAGSSPFTLKAPSITLSTEFQGTCYFEVEDIAGNIFTSDDFNVNLDTTPPAEYTPTKDTEVWHKAPLSFEIGIPSDVNNVTATLNDEPITLPYTAVVEDTGTHDFHLVTTDLAGNSTESDFSFKVDATPPKIRFTPSVTRWTNESYTYTYVITDDESGVGENAVTPKDVIADANGMGGSIITIRDKVGNVDQVVLTHVWLDVAPPIINGITFSDDFAKEVILNIDAADSGSGIVGYATSADGPFTEDIIIPENGTYNIFAKDRTNNVSEPYEINVNRVDSTPPTLVDVIVDTDIILTAEITVEATDERSTPLKYAVTKVADAVPSAWRDSNEFSLEGNGTYYIYVKDEIGNISAPREVVITHVDDRKPVLEVKVSSNKLTNKNVTVTLDATDETELVYSFDAGTTFDTLTEKVYRESTTIPVGTLIAKDVAGNTASNTEEVIINIDKIPARLIDADVTETNGEYILTIVTDPEDVEYSYDGGVTWTDDNPYTTPTKLDPNKILVRDEAGNLTRINNPDIWKDENIKGGDGDIIAGIDIVYNDDGTYTITIRLRPGESYSSYVYSFDSGRNYSDKYSITVPKTTIITRDMIRIKAKASGREITIPPELIDQIISETTPVVENIDWTQTPDGDRIFTIDLRDGLNPDDYEFSFDGGKTFGPNPNITLKPGDPDPDPDDIIIRRKDGGAVNTDNLDELLRDALAESKPLDQDKTIRYELDQVTGQFTLLPAYGAGELQYSLDDGKTWKKFTELDFNTIDDFLNEEVLIKDKLGRILDVDEERIKNELAKRILDASVLNIDSSNLIKDKLSTVQIELSPDLNTATFNSWEFKLDGKPIPASAIRLVGSTITLNITPTTLSPVLTIAKLIPAIPDAELKLRLTAQPNTTSSTTQQPTTTTQQPTATTQQPTTSQPTPQYKPTDIYQPYNDPNANVSTPRASTSPKEEKVVVKEVKEIKEVEKVVVVSEEEVVEEDEVIVPQMITKDEAMAKGYITEDRTEENIPVVTPTYIVENLTISEDDVTPTVYNSLKQQALEGLSLGQTLVDRVFDNALKDISFNTEDENVDVVVEEYSEFADIQSTTVIHGIEDVKERLAELFAVTVMASVPLLLLILLFLFTKRLLKNRIKQKPETSE